MAETLPTPRVTPEVEEKVPADIAGNHLEAALDELLKRYLLLLDQYTQARQQLSSDLSSVRLLSTIGRVNAIIAH